MESYIDTSPGATTFVGPDATELFRVMTLRGALDLYTKTKIVPTRHLTISKMLVMASNVTHKPYKRGDAAKAASDLTDWIEAMKAAMPIVETKNG
jgi:hypothetical protein